MLVIAAMAAVSMAMACTSAIVSGSVTKNGRPLLWKHRDASDLNNKVERILATQGRYEYVALFNAGDTLCREAWVGFNQTGFAVMNTASYNLKSDTVSIIDREGFLMSEALATCQTVDDFERLLNRLPKPLGVEANFGVIDADGNAAYFETSNDSYAKFIVEDCLIRTNYSESGRKDEGYGYVRAQNAEMLISPYIASRTVEPQVFTEVLSRSFYHSLMDYDFSHSGLRWIVDKDFIPRYSSSASVVIEGVRDGETPLATTMWTVLGYPPCSVVEPAWLGSDGIPDDLKANPETGRSEACDRANERKNKVFPIKRDRGEAYIDRVALFGNGEKPGICQAAHEASLANYEEGYKKLDKIRKGEQKK